MAALLVMIACMKTEPATPAPTPRPQSPAPAGPRIIFPDSYTVHLEIAADDETRTQGLMYRDRLPEATGMLFLFAQPGDFPFWMKNTLIPLDLIWLDASHKIVHIAHDVPPSKADPCPSYPPNAVASYVLEVPAGAAAKHHLAGGQTLRFEGLEHVVVR
jgi:uncharacterized membrane protein (UPF0127 family)